MVRAETKKKSFSHWLNQFDFYKKSDIVLCMISPKVDVKPIDFHGEAYYTVFINGGEMTGAYCGLLPVKHRSDAYEVAEEILSDMNVVED